MQRYDEIAKLIRCLPNLKCMINPSNQQSSIERDRKRDPNLAYENKILSTNISLKANGTVKNRSHYCQRKYWKHFFDNLGKVEPQINRNIMRKGLLGN